MNMVLSVPSLFCQGGDGGLGGYAVFRLFGDDGRPRVTIQVDRVGVVINLCSEEGRTLVGFGSNQDSTGMCINDEDGQPRILAGVYSRECKSPVPLEPQIDIQNRDGTSATITASGMHTYGRMPRLRPKTGQSQDRLRLSDPQQTRQRKPRKAKTNDTGQTPSTS